MLSTDPNMLPLYRLTGLKKLITNFLFTVSVSSNYRCKPLFKMENIEKQTQANFEVNINRP